MILGAVVDEPVPMQPVHTLLSASRNLSDVLNLGSVNWQAGLVMRSDYCGPAGSWVPCLFEDTADDLTPVPSSVEALPITHFADFACRARLGTDYDAAARMTLGLKMPGLIEREFWRGDKAQAANAATADSVPNDYLAKDPTILMGGTPANLVAALASLQDAIAGCGLGVIHADRTTVGHWKRLGQVVQHDGFRLYDLYGNRVVGGAGYDGSAPISVDAGQAAGTGTTRWAYATSAVWYALSDFRRIGDATETLNRQTNEVEVRAEADALLVTAPCCTYAVDVDLTLDTD